MIIRRKTRTVTVGSLKMGQSYPVSVQSMTKTDTQDVKATVRQIRALEQTGCEIIRVAVKNIASAQVLNKIKSRISIPLVADIHFNYRLALEAIRQGVDAVRLNPGNIYRKEEVEQVVCACKKKKIAIRIGLNSGSLGNRQPGAATLNPVELMVAKALDYVKLLERLDFYDTIISLKASDIPTTVSAYRKMAGLCDYPFHLGVTASGLPETGVIKSAIGIGALLLDGIGDTLRVSLTGPPNEEVITAQGILQALGLRNFGPEVIACPTCGRAQADVIKIARELKRALSGLKPQDVNKLKLKIAVMGCEVNGPGEAREADIGVACGKAVALLFKKGKVIKRVKPKQIVRSILNEVDNALE